MSAFRLLPLFRTPIIALAAVLALFLAGCGDKAEQSSPADSAAASTTSSTHDGKHTDKPVDSANVTPKGLPAVPKVAGAKGARADVQLKGCPATKAGATATGTVKNSGKSATDYAITISWVNKRSDVRSRGTAVVQDLAPGAKRSWKVAAPAHSGIRTCTVFVQRGTVQ